MAKTFSWEAALPPGINIHKMPSKEALPLIAKATKGRIIAEFSGGKDSVGMMLVLREHFSEIVPVFFNRAYTSLLRFQREAIEYYERLWGLHVVVLPHPILYELLAMTSWMPWHTARVVANWDLPRPPKFQFNDMLFCVREDLGWPDDIPAAVGVRAVDSVFRRWAVAKTGIWSKSSNLIYPIFDWQQQQMLELLKETKTLLAPDYRIMGRSFDGLDYRFLAPIKEHYPDDYERIKSLFPLIDAELLRYQMARDREKAALYTADFGAFGSAKKPAVTAPSFSEVRKAVRAKEKE